MTDVSVVHGDCLDVMRGMGEASVDAIVTDPPYGLEFMGKDWDGPWKRGDDVNDDAGFGAVNMADGYTRLDKPSYTGSTNPKCLDCGGTRRGRRDGTASRKVCLCVDGGRFPNVRAAEMRAFGEWCEEWATECLRVLKPGGYMLAFGGTRTWHRLAVAVEDAGFEIRDSIAWLHGQGFPKGAAGLKPAHEPIVVARKRPAAPRTGLLQIEACRVGTPEDKKHPGTKTYQRFDTGSACKENQVVPPYTVGRWPANVVLDETQAHALDQMSGVGRARGNVTPTRSGKSSWFMGEGSDGVANPGDMGGASRFMYVAKASKKERPVVNGVAHATVKPLTLMRWLVRLVTPPGGTVLDPFAGSGTTIEAAILEGFAVIGIERDAEYLPLIDVRIARNDPTLDLGDGGAA